MALSGSSTSPHPRLLLAEWIAPMDAHLPRASAAGALTGGMSAPIPPVGAPAALLRQGAVAISGDRILAVGQSHDLRAKFPDAAVEELGQSVLLPGLVNAHVHFELSALSPGDQPASFVDWLKRLMPQIPIDPDKARDFVEHGVRTGLDQCPRFGVTTVGDISRYCTVTRPLLRSASLRVVSYGELLAMAQRRHLLEERLAVAVDRSHESDRVRIAVSPHAPYSVEAEGYRRCLEKAREMNLPLATHLAETRDEGTFLARHAGPFRELWDFLGAWDDRVEKFTGGPIRFAAALGLLDYPTLLAHVNYCDDEELTMLAASAASVVYCPRTHAFFGHPPHRWREMLAAGINVAVGTDSCGSSPDLNLVDDLRLLRRLAPEIPPVELWQMATVRAARAVGCEDHVGSITPGKFADLTAFAVSSDDPLREILDEPMLPAKVWFAGREES